MKMVSLSYPKSPNSLQIFSSMNKSPSSPQNSCTKHKTLIHNFIFSHIYRVSRAFSKAKSIILEIIVKGNQLIFLKQSHKKNIYRNKILFGSFRLHYNWCSSSHVLPINISSPNYNITLEGKNGKSSSKSTIYCDSSWNSMFSTTSTHDDHEHQQGQFGNNKEELEQEEGGELSSYLQWLEEKGNGEAEDEIDKLADMFIESCHEKFRLEKIESYRRFQAMLARSM